MAVTSNPGLYPGTDQKSWNESGWLLMLVDACPIPRKDGSPCRAWPTKSGYCLAHDPALSEKREQARLKGGYGKSRVARAERLLPQELQALDDVLSTVITGVYAGNLLPSQGSSIAALASARVRLREIALKMAEQGELKERIQKLEVAINDIGLKNRTNGTAARRG
jgi:hypothetical protein